MGRISPFASSLAILAGAMILLLWLSLLSAPEVVGTVLQYLVVAVLLPAYVFTLAIWFMVARLKRRGPRRRAPNPLEALRERRRRDQAPRPPP